MARRFKTYNYVTLASEIASSSRYVEPHEKHLSEKEYVDARLEYIRTLGKSPDHQFLGVLLEQELAFQCLFHLGERKAFDRVLYTLQAYNPFFNPIASSLSQAVINDFKNIWPGSIHYDKWDDEQIRYVDQQLGRRTEKLRESKSGVTLKTGFDGYEYYINKYSYTTASFFYAMNAIPQCFPADFTKAIQHGCGIEQVRNSPKSKTIRKCIAENLENGDFPIAIDLGASLERNLVDLMDWLKPKDVKFAAAYVFGKRDVAWIEKLASASEVLDRMVIDLGTRGFHQKWVGSYPALVLDLCEHLKIVNPSKASNAFYDLACAMAEDKVLKHSESQAVLDRMAKMAGEFVPSPGAGLKGLLATKLVQHRIGKLESDVVKEFVADNDLENTLRQILDSLYPNVIARAKVLESFGLRSNTQSLMREKGRALSDDLGL